MGRFVFALIVFLSLAVPAFATDPDDPGRPSSTTEDVAVAPILALAAAMAIESAPATPTTEPIQPPAAPRAAIQRSRPAALPALYVSSALLHGYDAYSTIVAMRLGAEEANPLMKAAVTRPAAFVGVKAAVTTVSIMSAEKLWKSHHRRSAVAMMLVSNAFMVWVATNNTAVIAEMRRQR